MTYKYTQPIVEEVERGEFKRSHPSYGKIQISRVSGQKALFQSSIEHQHFIALRISGAYVQGSDDSCVMSTNQVVEVAMSESQFARMVTSLNMGSGSPCTIQRIAGKAVEQPINEDLQDSHRNMVQGKLKGVLDAQLALSKKIKDWRDAKHRPTLKEMDELAHTLECQASNFEDNMGYYAQVFEEHMETVVDDAKSEVEGHILHTAGRLGVAEKELPRLTLSEETDAK